MSLKCLMLNCTLKKTPAVSNTEALLNKIVEVYKPLGVECEMIRPVDYNIPFGVSSYEGEGDQWPEILDKIKQADIIILGMSIWFGVRCSVAQMVIERLDGTYDEGDPETGRFPLYSKVAGTVVTGNEDGAHDCAANTLFNLSHMGCVVPPNADCYWVGDAGPGPSYIDAGGDRHVYTNKTARYLAHNTAYMAKLMQENPFPTNLKALIAEAEQVCGKADEKPAHRK